MVLHVEERMIPKILYTQRVRLIHTCFRHLNDITRREWTEANGLSSNGVVVLIERVTVSYCKIAYCSGECLKTHCLNFSNVDSISPDHTIPVLYIRWLPADVQYSWIQGCSFYKFRGSCRN